MRGECTANARRMRDACVANARQMRGECVVNAWQMRGKNAGLFFLFLFLFLLLLLLDPGLSLLSLQDGTPNLYNAVTDENATFTTRS